MSTIYNQEPKAHGLVTIKTTFGELEVELFTQQCPKNTRNFIQLCLDGYYEGSIFDRVEKDFIAIGGEHITPGVDSIETDLVPDEFHQRLKFSRRGLLATANTEKNANGPKFFFTLGPAPELQNKHTIFGRFKGDSIYYLVDLNECHVDDDMRPLSEKKIIQVIVTENPYPDLKARPHIREKLKQLQTNDQDADDTTSSDYLKPKFDIKQSKKLSFYDDSDDDEGEKESANEDPTNEFKVPQPVQIDSDRSIGVTTKKEEANGSPKSKDAELEGKSNPNEDVRAKRLQEIREQFKKLKQKIENESATKIRTLSDRRRESADHVSPLNATQDSKANSSKHSSIDDPDPVSSKQELRLATKKGRQRERETIELMQQFKKKLKDASSKSSRRTETRDKNKNPKDQDQEQDDEETELALNLVDGDDWLHHKFDAKNTSSSSLAKDANTKGDDWYSIDDPRNPMVERVESERAHEYKRHRERDRHRDERDHDRDRDRDREKRHRSEHRSSRHHHR